METPRRSSARSSGSSATPRCGSRAVGGRVVKTLGDEVLFVTDDAASAPSRWRSTRVEAHEDDDELPSVRAGVAHGPVLVRLGDVFGTPVNLASRLTDEARPGTVLVDTVAAAALARRAYAVRRAAPPVGPGLPGAACRTLSGGPTPGTELQP